MAAEAGGAGRARARRRGAALPAAVSARTWLALIHLVSGLPLGVATFTAALTGAALGVGLLPAFLAGLPVLAATGWLCDWFALGERRRFALLLGTVITFTPPPPDPRPLRPYRIRVRALSGRAVVAVPTSSSLPHVIAVTARSGDVTITR